MQGKTNKQRKDSTRFAILGIVGIVAIVFVLAMANAMEPTVTEPEQVHYWTPTVDDILYQDSMFQIIEATQINMDTINKGMERILLKLDVIIYENGLSDSIKLYDQKHVDAYEAYMDRDGVEKGININSYTDEERLWITANGDTIYE